MPCWRGGLKPLEDRDVPYTSWITLPALCGDAVRRPGVGEVRHTLHVVRYLALARCPVCCCTRVVVERWVAPE